MFDRTRPDAMLVRTPAADPARAALALHAPRRSTAGDLSTLPTAADITSMRGLGIQARDGRYVFAGVVYELLEDALVRARQVQGPPPDHDW